MRTGSLINHLADNALPGPAPEVGMGATIVGWSDRYAATIVEVSPSGHRLVVTRDDARRTDSNGMSDAQSYEYTSRPDSILRITFTRRRDGSYRERGGTQRLLVGVRDHYHDYTF